MVVIEVSQDGQRAPVRRDRHKEGLFLHEWEQILSVNQSGYKVKTEGDPPRFVDRRQQRSGGLVQFDAPIGVTLFLCAKKEPTGLFRHRLKVSQQVGVLRGTEKENMGILFGVVSQRLASIPSVVPSVA